MRAAYLLAAVGLIVSFGACSDGETDGTGGDGPTLPEPYTLDNVCVPYVTRTCEALEGCCDTAGLAFERGDCESRQRAVCEGYVERAEHGELTFDPTQVDACLEEIEHIYGVCQMPLTTYAFEIVDLTNICAGMVHGHAAVGEPCTQTVDCAPSPGEYTFCDSTTTMACARLRTRQAGQSCGAEDLCVPNTYCDATGTCQNHLGIGEPCDPADDVACGLVRHCDDVTMLCAEAKGSDAACTAGVECASLVCDEVCAPIAAIVSATQCSP